MSKKIVFLDIDGTTLDTKKKVPESAKLAIEKLQKSGIEVVIATGRPISETRYLLDQLNIKNSITFNGGMMIYNGKTYVQESIGHELFKKILEKVMTYSVGMKVFGDTGVYVINPGNSALQKVSNKINIDLTNEKVELNKINNILSLNLFAEDGELIKEFDFIGDNLNKDKWQNILPDGLHLELYPKHHDKVRAIEHLLRLANIDKSDAVAFGDGSNDIEMLKFVGTGVAMGNAKDAVKKAADFITKHVDEDGLYQGLKEIGLV